MTSSRTTTTPALPRQAGPLPTLRSRVLRRSSVEQERFYAGVRDDGAIARWQLDRFNELWQTLRRDVPHYRSLSGDRSLPSRFCSLEEFRDGMPPMDRGTLQVAGDALRNPGARSSGVRTTGGSTAEPIKVEVTSGEARVAARDLWYARSWLGVDPADRLFLIWGHSHTLGEGPRSLITGMWRKAKDLALGYARHSAYDMTDDGLRIAAERMLSFRPTWVLGYAVALDRFARVNADRGDALRGLGLKAVVCTAEAFPRQDSRRRLAQLFGCPVVMEYGSVETGPIAHERAPDRYLVFWRHHLLEAVESTDVPGAYELLVTSLFHRRTPLVRYRMGDLIVPVEGSPSVHRELRRVLGRCNDVVVLRDGTRIHSEGFTHALKDIPGISRFQVVQQASGEVVLQSVAPRALAAAALARLHRRLGRTHPAMKEVVVERVESLPLTIAGKSRPIRHE